MTAGAIRAPFIMPLRPPIPGVPKNNIDTRTKIELKSESEGVDIFFTIDGTKPNPNTNSRGKDTSTYKYKVPFCLPPGKRPIKAVAVSRDRNRESNVVTKTFDVDIIQDDEGDMNPQADNYGFLKEMDSSPPTGISSDARNAARTYIRKLLKEDAWADDTKERRRSPSPGPRGIGDSGPIITESSEFSHRDRGTGRFMQSRLGSTQGVTFSTDVRTSDGTVNARPLSGDDTFHSRRGPPETSTQALRLQRETDFLKCIYCFAPRPADPYARFCNSCGKPVPALPQSRLPPPEPGQMGMCVHCRSMVPFNVPTCLVCEMPMPPQNQAQASQRLQNRLLCSICGTANPPSLDSCVTCEARLDQKARPIHVGEMAPPLPASGAGLGLGLDATATGPRLVSCTRCGRVNSADARFCDWCGAKPQPALAKLVCAKCSAHNHPYARFCATCGALMSPPPRGEPGGAGGAQWMPVSMTLPSNATAGSDPASGQAPLWARFSRSAPSESVATQTVGLFFPSTAEMRKRDDDEEARRRTEREMRDRAPLLTAVSPGRGYWRKQMDHIVAHLKAHAANDAEFRTLVGEPRMGKLLSSEIHEDGYELNLSVTFALKDYKDPYRGAAIGSGQYLSAVTQGRNSHIDSYRSEDMESIISTGRRRVKKKKPAAKKNDNDSKLSVQEKALIREIGKNGEGRSNEIQQLVDEGADPNCKNKDGVPALILAVRNRHKESIPALVQCGANVNVKGPEKGNSPLHEAVAMGLDGEDVLTALLGCGASTKLKNDRGETAYDLAAKSKIDPLIKRLAAKMGQSQLDRMLAPRQAEKDAEF